MVGLGHFHVRSFWLDGAPSALQSFSAEKNPQEITHLKIFLAWR